MPKKKIAILISGNGSNLQAIIDAMQAGELPIDIRSVISNNADAYGLQRAKAAGIHTEVVNHRDYQGRQDFDLALQEAIDAHKPGLVILAGFLWLIPESLIKLFPSKIINIHPALLPKYGGKGMFGIHVHEAVKKAKEKESGITIHSIDEKYDEGRIIFQQSTSF